MDMGVRERETSRRSHRVLAGLLGGDAPSGLVGKGQGRQGNVEPMGRAMLAGREEKTHPSGEPRG